ncbi:MAG: DUF177 domain-containing protein [Bacteroidales bacterium]|nr:DUF177 domain-containing protein [Bacteroidales bacterium]
MMSGEYAIPVSGLKDGRHHFDFKINKKFFDKFEESEVKEGELVAVVSADKQSTHMDLSTQIKGFVNISCDRCLGIFSLPVECSNRLLVKFGKDREDDDPEIITIAAEEAVLDLMQYFYEYVLLALPIQRIHPDDEDGNSTCDPEMLAKLRDHLVDEAKHKDHRWDELEKLMNNN